MADDILINISEPSPIEIDIALPSPLAFSLDAGVSIHNLLSGLQGGITDQFYHLTAADYAARILGSGTPGYIPYFTGAQALGNSNIFYDVATGKIGIGTTTPTRNLSVFGSTMIYKGTPLVFTDPTAVDLIVTNSNGNSRFFFGQGTSAFGGFNWVYNANVMLAYLQVGWGLSGMTFLRNKNIGIQTDAPVANVQIDQATLGPGGKVSVSGTTVTEVLNGSLCFRNTFKVGDSITITTSAGVETQIITSITSNASLETTAFVGTTASANYNLAGGVRFSVLGNGNIGVGLVSPTARLHLPASEARADSASMKINPGVVAAVPVSGNIESDGTHLYWTDSGGTRRQLDN